MRIELYERALPQAWDDYVARSAEATNYHRSGWKAVIEETFGHRAFYLAAFEGERIVGVLPLFLQSSLLFGRFLTSLPFFNYGGLATDTAEARTALLEASGRLARRLRVDHVELRHRAPYDIGWPEKTSKVTLVLDLPRLPRMLWDSFKPKVRNQIRRGEKAGLTSEVRGLELLDPFYEIFSVNMRDLGTPVYPRRLFANVLERFPSETRICCVYLGRKALAANLLCGFRDTIEMPWASSLRAFNHLRINMVLYWRMLSYACDAGYQRFDFGRSSKNSGTFRFKHQWGARPLQLYWHYWLPKKGPLPQINPDNPKYRAAIRLWRQLPVGVTRAIGPLLSRHLP